jgi:hypothetical protein
LMNVTRSPMATTSCRGSAPVGAMRITGGSIGAGAVGPDGPGEGVPDEPLPQADAATASAPVTNEEKIFRGQ